MTTGFSLKQILSLIGSIVIPVPVLAQSIPVLPRPTQPFPEIPLPPPVSVPSPTVPAPVPFEAESNDVPILVVSRFEYQGNTVLSSAQLDQVTAPYLNRPLSFNDLLDIRTQITQAYVERGYVTSGAVIPPSPVDLVQTDATLLIQIIEGTIEQINVTGSERLANYVRSRLAVATSPVVNQPRLTQALRLLAADPLLRSISADLAVGSRLGQNILNVQIEANPSFRATVELSNHRNPAVGSFEQRLELSSANLMGLGDRLGLSYSQTEGSNGGTIKYAVPLNPRHTELEMNLSFLNGRVVESPFNLLDIQTQSRAYEITLRQPLFQRASSSVREELAMGVTVSRLESESSLLGIPFPLSSGADENGQLRISALRFFQEYFRRSHRQVLALRSQLSMGFGAFNSTVNDAGPDSRFLIWRGQSAFVQQLGRGSSLVARANVQLADRPLVSFEQFSLGGVGTVRGYRQDAALGDQGVWGSLEMRFPLLSRPLQQLELQVYPFLDAGYVWSHQAANSQMLASMGVGTQFTWGHVVANLSYGLPLVTLPTVSGNLQEDGFSASVRYVVSW